MSWNGDDLKKRNSCEGKIGWAGMGVGREAAGVERWGPQREGGKELGGS